MSSTTTCAQTLKTATKQWVTLSLTIYGQQKLVQGNGNRCTCMDGTLSAARKQRIEADTPSYVHLPLQLVLLYQVQVFTLYKGCLCVRSASLLTRQ